MDTVNCKDYKVGQWVALQMDGLAFNSFEYYGEVKEVGKTQMKIEIPFHNAILTHTLFDGQQVMTIRKD